MLLRRCRSLGRGDQRVVQPGVAVLGRDPNHRGRRGRIERGAARQRALQGCSRPGDDGRVGSRRPERGDDDRAQRAAVVGVAGRSVQAERPQR